MNSLEMISSGITILRKAYYKLQINLTTDVLSRTSRYSYDYNVRKRRLQRYLNKYIDLTDGTKTRRIR